VTVSKTSICSVEGDSAELYAGEGPARFCMGYSSYLDRRVSIHHIGSIRVRVRVSALARAPSSNSECPSDAAWAKPCRNYVRMLVTYQPPLVLLPPTAAPSKQNCSHESPIVLAKGCVRRRYWLPMVFRQGQTRFPGSSEMAMGGSWPRKQSTE